MSFADDQIRRLERSPNARWIKEREIDGRFFPYLEGWRAIAEANRIFGHANWDRETIASDCVATRTIERQFAVSYLVRVRITVRAGAAVIIRDGCGSAEASAQTPGQAHERAAKAAETDATKRALSTFGPSFGLALYAGLSSKGGNRRQMSEARTGGPHEIVQQGTLDPDTGLVAQIDKSVLTLPEPRRRRDREHLRLVASHPCLVCGRQPSDAHHLRFAQPRALARKVSDEFTVPLCRSCHQQLHAKGDEREWWRERGINPEPVAESLWRESRNFGEAAE